MKKIFLLILLLILVILYFVYDAQAGRVDLTCKSTPNISQKLSFYMVFNERKNKILKFQSRVANIVDSLIEVDLKKIDIIRITELQIELKNVRMFLNNWMSSEDGSEIGSLVIDRETGRARFRYTLSAHKDGVIVKNDAVVTYNCEAEDILRKL